MAPAESANRLLQGHERMTLAVELLRRNARVSIAHQETGVSRSKLRALYREIHGRSAASGMLPSIGCAVIGTLRQQLHASLFAVIYVRLGGKAVYRMPNLRATLAAQDLYGRLAPPDGDLLDFNAAWVIARDLRVGASRLTDCPVCAVRYLVSDNSRAPMSCPVCALYDMLAVKARNRGRGGPQRTRS